MGKVIKIGERLVGEGQPAFVIAEAGANHNGDLSIAKDLIRAARDIGCDSIKFQTFSAEEFCADRSKTFTYKSQGKEVTESEYEMFKRFEFSREEWAELMRFCEEQGIFFFTTVQDPVNLEMMLELGLQCIKVGSDDFDHLVNLRRYAATGLPLVISKGMADLGEVDRVISALRPLTDKLAVLHCVSLYPTDPAQLNIRQLPKLAEPHDADRDLIGGGLGCFLPAALALVGIILPLLAQMHQTLQHDPFHHPAREVRIDKTD